MKRCLLYAALLLSSLSLKCQLEVPAFLSTGVDELPENYGGKEELKRFLDFHLVYPENALKKKIEGKVDIQYTCNDNGEISSYKLLNTVDPEIDAEALRLFGLLLWNPAIKQRQPVKYEHFISIPFSVSRYKKTLKRKDKENANPAKLPVDTSTVIYDKVNKQPVYIHGSDSLLKYIAAELEYPQEAKSKNLEGTVVLTFIVEPNGFISNIEVKKPVAGGCNEEAVRVIGQTKWFPGKKDDRLVRCKMTYSIVFKLNSGYRDNVQGSQRMGAY
ncbi:MAG: transport protein TonB [Bacteroidetes bacterium]|nr:transport protein TonB [Bacteroidota bacterium]